MDIATVTYRLERIEGGHAKLAEDVEVIATRVAVHDEQISGSGGLVKAMEKLGGKVDSLNRALYAFAGSFIIAAVTVAIVIGTHR